MSDARTTVGVPRETSPGERRVAVTPAVAETLAKAGVEVIVESGAGTAAGFPDEAYRQKGIRVAGRNEVLDADVVLHVQAFAPGRATLELLRRGQVVIGFSDPLGSPAGIQELAQRGVTVFSLELVPRITRAQSMDALSSQATVAGYKAVILAAQALPRMFPMLTTAAGTIPPARAFVVGAGVAGLQAIATAKRLGAVVEAYDVRAAAREQVESVGARFVELPLEAGAAEDKGGYATALGEDFYRRQQELMHTVVAASDVVITTAAIPGKPAPVLVTEKMVKAMQPGSVVVDLAAERGGNVEPSQPDTTVTTDNGVTVLGPTNLPATVPFHASSMYARNISAFLLHLLNEGLVELALSDEIAAGTLLCRGGQVVHPKVREALGLDEALDARDTSTPAPRGNGHGAVDATRLGSGKERA